ncbi:TPA: hypothetical protein ACKOOP_004138 [Clostridioides difficile]
MIVKDKILVTAIRKFKGEVDNSKHDFTKITYVSLSSDIEDTDNRKGSYAKEILVGDSSVFDSIAKNNFPCIYDATFNIFQGRKGFDSTCENLVFVKSIDSKSL